jgi:hypothetical protein
MRRVIELRRRRAIVVAAAWLSLVTAPAVAGGPALPIARDPSGLGLVLPGGFWVSGDVTASVAKLEGEPATFEINDLSLLARWEPHSRFALFGELRLDDVFEAVAGEGTTGARDLIVERLYGEALLTPTLSLRMGKVFTPFGLWNVIDRAPLTWSVEQPAVTEGVFPERATGLTLLYQTTWHGWTFDATVYGPAQDEIRFDRSDESEPGLLVGQRSAVGRALGPAFASLGVNAAGFRAHDESDWTTATGLDLELFAYGHQVTGELTYRVPEDGSRTEHGLYLQDAFPLVGSLYGVLRFEYFRPRADEGRAATGQLVGLAWRPVPNVMVKGGYFFATRRLENFEPGFQVSLSLLF